MSQKEELDELYLKALKVQESGDFKEAFRLFMQGAALGYDAAQNAIGNAYSAGEGVEKDKNKALEWYKKAHKADGHTNFCGNIALTYAETGRRRQAIYWWRKAIANGDGEAAMSLALYLISSEQVLELVKMAANCEAPLHISPLSKEEAEDLLAILTRANWDEEAE